MMELASYSDWLLIGICGVLLLNLLVITRHSRRLRQMQQQQQHNDEAVAQMRRDLGALCSGAVGVGKRLVFIENKIRHQEERQDQLELRSTSDSAYQQAVRMVQQGAGLDEVLKSCAISRGEAELIVMLHRYDRANDDHIGQAAGMERISH
jgi:hypothetical protein